jgi:polyhydroxybutyrate depolymerase
MPLGKRGSRQRADHVGVTLRLIHKAAEPWQGPTMVRLFSLLLGALLAVGWQALFFALPLKAQPCGAEAGCTVASGFYRVHVPKSWDGKTPLPALIHFHGYRESAGEMMARSDLTDFAERRGVLLVFPHGEGNTWSYPGSPANYRDEFVFVDQVMADLGARFPLDRTRLLVSGFSQGAAMAWNLACYRGDRFSAFLAIAGTLWRPQPVHCPGAAPALIHIHGVADRMVPLEGRPIRGGAFHQGDAFRAMAMMRAAHACPASASQAVRSGALACEQLSGCASGKLLAFCFHPGGHDFDPVWLHFAWETLFKR